VVLIDRPLAVLDDAPATPRAGSQPAAAGWSGATLARASGITWLIGVVAALCTLATGLARLARLAWRARRVTSGVWVDAALELSQRFRLRRPPVILCSDDSSMIGTWGVLRAKVLVPASALEWPADRIRIVLAHEVAHVRRGDWMVQVAADLLRSVYWFNPVVWVGCGRLRLLSEQACDDAVLKLGVEGSDYASELIDLARAFVSDRPRFLPAAAIAHSSLERRVRAMLNAQLNRNPITRPASIAAALALTAVTVAVAGFGASAQSQFGSVAGTVSDQNGRPIAGATLVLSNAAAQEKHELKTDATGRYEFVGVTPATYELLFQFTGMAYIKREGLSVASGQAVTVNTVMQVGSVSETISVTPDEGPATPRPRVMQTARVEKPDPCATSSNGGCLRPPIKIKDVRPIYPAGVPGSTVVLNGRIDTNGLVTGLEVLHQADPALASAALDAVNGWEFLPTHLDGQPIETRMTVTVNFLDAK